MFSEQHQQENQQWITNMPVETLAKLLAKWMSTSSIGKVRAMREQVKRYLLPERKKRPKSRTVRMSKTRYPVRSKHVK
ncbi:hypothetical protein DA100_07220 [Vibrio sp. Hep-1b-8]|nr:hypothetical protein DA100_07220 [Vibrio sp. Hep-1b-8]